jgi:hypothetical protein
LFLRLMISHHEAAIPMAQAVLKRTEEPEVSNLARAIIMSQKAEIENMKAMVDEKVADSAEVALEPANGSGTAGTVALSKAEGGVKVVLKVSGLPNSGTMYLAHIHPGTCTEEGAEEHGHSHHEHGATEEIEYPLTPVHPDAKGDGTSTTLVHHFTLEGLLSGGPKHVSEIVLAKAGSFVVKPRGLYHAFCNTAQSPIGTWRYTPPVSSRNTTTGTSKLSRARWARRSAQRHGPNSESATGLFGMKSSSPRSEHASAESRRSPYSPNLVEG